MSELISQEASGTTVEEKFVKPKSTVQSVLALVFGILSLLTFFLFIFGIPFAIAGIILGVIAYRKPLTKLRKTGLMISSIGLLLSVGFLLYVIFFYAKKTSPSVTYDRPTNNVYAYNLLYFLTSSSNNSDLYIQLKDKKPQLFLKGQGADYVLSRSKHMIFFAEDAKIFSCNLKNIPCIPFLVVDLSKVYPNHSILNNAISLSPDSNYISFILRDDHASEMVTPPLGAVSENIGLLDLSHKEVSLLSKSYYSMVAPADFEDIVMTGWYDNTHVGYAFRGSMSTRNYEIPITGAKIDIAHNNLGTFTGEDGPVGMQTSSLDFSIGNQSVVDVVGSTMQQDNNTYKSYISLVPSSVLSSINPKTFLSYSTVKQYPKITTNNPYTTVLYDDEHIFAISCEDDNQLSNQTQTLTKGNCSIQIMNINNGKIISVVPRYIGTTKISALLSLQTFSLQNGSNYYKFIRANDNSTTPQKPFYTNSYFLVNMSNGKIIGSSPLSSDLNSHQISIF